MSKILPDSYRGRALLFAWVAGALVLTLVPARVVDPTRDYASLCLVCGSRGVADAVLNLVFFLPLGALLGRRIGVSGAIAAGLTFSAGIELAQLAVPGRFSTLGDVVVNGLGSGLGAVIVTAPKRTLTWSAPLALLGLFAPIPLLAPAAPDATFYGQWTADLGTLEVYDGRVLAAEVGGISLPDGPHAESEAIGRAIEERAGIRVRFLVGTPPAGLAPVFSIYDHRRQETLLLGADGEDLVFRVRIRADVVRLDHPEWRAYGALAEVARGDTAVVEVTRSAGSSPCMSLNRRTQCAVAPGFAAGWTLLMYPPPLAGPVVLALSDLLWAGLLAVPLGWVMGGRGRASAAGMLTLALLLALSALSPDMRLTLLPGLPLLAGFYAGGLLAERWV